MDTPEARHLEIEKDRSPLARQRLAPYCSPEAPEIEQDAMDAQIHSGDEFPFLRIFAHAGC